jgi:hypothetical protein
MARPGSTGPPPRANIRRPLKVGVPPEPPGSEPEPTSTPPSPGSRTIVLPASLPTRRTFPARQRLGYTLAPPMSVAGANLIFLFKMALPVLASIT